MRIGSKLILVQFFLLVCLSLGVMATLYWLVLPGVEQIEREAASTQVDRVRKALLSEQDRLYIQSKDWGAWDDTYAYVHEPTSVYEASNLAEGTLASLRMDLVLIIHSSGTVVREQFSEELGDNKSFWIETLSQKPWDAQHPLQLVIRERGALVETPAGVMLLAGHPIIPSDGEGAARGFLYFGRFIDQRLVSELSERLEIELNLSIDKPLDVTQSTVEFVSGERLTAQGEMPILNRPDLTLRISVDEARPFYQKALNGAKYAVVSIMLAGTVICLLVFVLLNKVLVSPILLLQRQAELFGRNNELSDFQPLHRDDELGALSRSFLTMAKRLQDSWWMLSRERNNYLDASHTDPLTQLRNRRFMEQQLSERDGWYPAQNWLFMMLDLDHFKAVNDLHGHDVGDLVLEQFATLLNQLSRTDDMVIRYGGEEFVIVCRNTDEAMACSIAERIRQRVEQFTFGKEEKPLTLTCSIGFFSLYIDPPTSAEYEVPWRSMLKVADLALYAAKNSGRNTWVGLKCLEPCKQGLYPSESAQVGEHIHKKQLSLYSALSPVSRVRW